MDISSYTPQEPYVDIHCTPGTGTNCNTSTPDSFTMRLWPSSSEYFFGPPCGNQSLVLKKTFTGVVTLAPNSWTLLMNSNYRQSGIMNMINSTNTSIATSATLDNSSGLINNSPEFISDEIPYTLYGNQHNLFTMQTVDIDGDSISYEFITPQRVYSSLTCPQPVTGFTQPPHFRLNSANGKLETVPFNPLQGLYTMAIQANEFRHINGTWHKIGSIQRDITYTVLTNLTNYNPHFTGLTRDNTALNFDQVIPVNPGRTVTLLLTTTDADASQNRSTTISVPEIYRLPLANHPQIQPLSVSQTQLTWQVPTYLPVGKYVFSISVADNFCRIKGREIRPLTFEVTNRVLTNTRHLTTPRIAAYPMPFHERVQFQLAGGKAESVEIIDSLGRIVARLTSQADGTVVWQPTESVAPGAYIARTIDGMHNVRLVRY